MQGRRQRGQTEGDNQSNGFFVRNKYSRNWINIINIK